MDGKERRKAILEELKGGGRPVSASALARRLGVSRQIIVGDVALLRSAGAAIAATPRGYMLQEGETGLRRQVACRHTAGEMTAELYAMVDNGCTVVDVIVEHPVYGQLTGGLQLKSRYDVDRFVERSRGVSPLSLLTEGVHLHTLLCPDEAALERVREALRELGILFAP